MTTYAQLKTDLAEWSSKSNLTSKMGTFIALAEAQIATDVRVMEMQQPTTLVVDDTGAATLPDGFLGFRHVALEISTGLGATSELTYLSPDQFHERKLNGNIFSGNTRDGFYTLQGNTILLSPVPGSGLSSTIDTTYWKRFDALSDTNTTNWLLTNHYNVYLFAALRELYDYLRNSEQDQKYHKRYLEAIGTLHRSERRKARSGPHIRQAGGVTP